MVVVLLLLWHRNKSKNPPAPTDTASQDGRDEMASMIWENSSRGFMGARAGRTVGGPQRALSLDSSTYALASLGYDSHHDLPTYRQSQRELKKSQLPSYTRASTYTRACPLRLTVNGILTLAPPLDDDAELPTAVGGDGALVPSTAPSMSTHVLVPNARGPGFSTGVLPPTSPTQPTTPSFPEHQPARPP